MCVCMYDIVCVHMYLPTCLCLFISANAIERENGIILTISAITVSQFLNIEPSFKDAIANAINYKCSCCFFHVCCAGYGTRCVL